MGIFKASLDSGKVILLLPDRITIDENTVIFRKIIRALLAKDLKDIVLDFSNTLYIDSSGIGELVSSFTMCSKFEGSLVLNNTNQRLTDLLAIVKLLTIFNLFTVDYSKNVFVEVSPNNLELLLKHSTFFKNETLELLLTLSGGKIQILPSQREGLYRISLGQENGSDLIVAAPHLIADLTRSFIHDEISEFEELINSSKCKELDVQRFLEKHPKFLLGHEYEKLHPQIILEREEGALIPDFLLQPYKENFCDIVDLKLPNARLIVGTPNRKRFSSAISEAAAQLRTYQDYFDDRHNREMIKEKYGITAYRPKIAVIVGRNPEIDKMLYKQIQQGLSNIQILTYDDLIEKAKNFLLL